MQARMYDIIVSQQSQLLRCVVFVGADRYAIGQVYVALSVVYESLSILRP